ncbi:MAG: hypothetical protein ACRDD1_21380, partial [Planctomycetia bacterium]
MTDPSTLPQDPPSSSDSVSPALLRRAADFMAEVRDTQRRSGRNLTGRTYLSEQTQTDSREARRQSALLAELARPPHAVVPPDLQQDAFERFEEMCRRRKIAFPADLRPPVYRLLAVEIAANSDLLETDPGRIAAATLYNGFLGGLNEQFPEFQDTPGIIRHAVGGYPSDPAGFLRRARETVARLESDERFADFRDTPGLFRQAAVNVPSDPEGYLDRVRAAEARLAADGRFAAFRETPSVFRNAAVRQPSDPEAFLLRVQAIIARLQADERFAEFRDAPHLFLDTALRNPTAPEE